MKAEALDLSYSTGRTYAALCAVETSGENGAPRTRCCQPMTASDSCTPCREYVSEEQLQRKVRESFVRAHLDSIADQLHQARRVDDTDELRCRLDRAGAELDVLQELAKNLESEDQE